MKYFCCILFCFFFALSKGNAQLADGSIVPDFTFTDINGNTQNLYSYLDQGKYVVLDISATWCVPCWNYHNTGTLDSIYQAHDQPGAGDWKIMLIEADANTDSADLHGTGSNTQGDWVQGAGYTIIDPLQGAALSSFKNGYAVSFYPTFYMICPDRKVYQDTFLNILRPHVSTWEYAANTLCAATGLKDINNTGEISIYPNPAGDKVAISAPVNWIGRVKLRVLNVLGQVVDERDYDISPASWSWTYDASHLTRGLHYFMLSGAGANVTKKVLLQ